MTMPQRADAATEPVYCQPFSEHTWSEARVLFTGCHPGTGLGSGPYQLTRRLCTKCDKAIFETIWLRQPAGRLDPA